MATTEEILAAIRERSKGVGYSTETKPTLNAQNQAFLNDSGVDYNKDNRDNKENKDNKLSMNNTCGSRSLDLGANAPLESELNIVVSGQQEEEKASPDADPFGALAPTPMLDIDMVDTAIVQLFDNGEAAAQRYKLKIRLNLQDGENPEFIANLTKDRRNFKKFIPEECREEILAMADAARTRIKEVTGSYPYIGKFHYNEGHGAHSHRTQIEPHTLAVVWFNPVDKAWSCSVNLYNFNAKLDLFTDHVTEKQKKTNVKAQATWQHPRIQKQNRPKTWAERRTAK